MHVGEKFGFLPKGMGRDMLLMTALASTPSRVYAAAYRGGLHVTAAIVGRFHTPHVKPGSAPKARSMKVHTSAPRNYGIRRIGGGPPLGVSAGSLGLGLMILAPVAHYLEQQRTSSLEYHR